MNRKCLAWHPSIDLNCVDVASTFASTPLQIKRNLLIYMRLYFLKLLIILWSLVRVQVGPPKKRKTLVSDDGGFAFNAISISVLQLQTLLEDLQIQDRYVLQIQ